MRHASRQLATGILAGFIALAALGCDGYGSGTIGISRSNATLASLTLSAASLIPAFAASTTTYTATVPNATTSTTVTATTATNGATITVANVTVASGVASGPISLAVGGNPIPIVVTNPDGGTRTYTVTVTRNP